MFRLTSWHPRPASCVHLNGQKPRLTIPLSVWTVALIACLTQVLLLIGRPLRDRSVRP